MTNHEIHLTLHAKRDRDPARVAKDHVKAEQNLLGGVAAGDTVTWLLPQEPAGRGLRVVFKEFEPRNGSTAAVPPPPDGPFSSLSPQADRIVGTVSGAVEQGLYLYEVFAGSTRLRWLEPLPDGRNFGGLDVPQPPGG